MSNQMNHRSFSSDAIKIVLTTLEREHDRHKSTAHTLNECGKSVRLIDEEAAREIFSRSIYFIELSRAYRYACDILIGPNGEEP